MLIIYVQVIGTSVAIFRFNTLDLITLIILSDKILMICADVTNIVVVVVVAGQTAGSIFSKTLPTTSCLCTLELRTASMIATC